MTDMTDAIEATGEQIGDLSTDLEAHLEDILEINVDVWSTDVDYDSDPECPPRLSASVELDELEAELEDRLDAHVTAGSLSISIEPMEGRENE